MSMTSAGPMSPEMRRRYVLWLNRLGPFLGLLGVYTLFAILEPGSFFSFATFESIMRQAAITGTAAIGMTLVIILAGIDLSVGSIVALTTVVIALLLQVGANPLLAAGAGVLAGALCGLVNGLLITRLRLMAFIATLGTMGMVRGLAKGLAGERTVNPPEATWLNDLLGVGDVLYLSPGVFVMLVLAVLVALLLRYTRLGRHIFAIGSNEQAARLCGVRVERVKLVVYTLCAALAGLAGLMQFSKLTIGDPTIGFGLELNVIAAVVIGGGSLFGGEGSIFGSIVGAIMITVIKVGCTHAQIAPWIQEIITGAIIVAAVTLDQLRHRWAGTA